MSPASHHPVEPAALGSPQAQGLRKCHQHTLLSLDALWPSRFLCFFCHCSLSSTERLQQGARHLHSHGDAASHASSRVLPPCTLLALLQFPKGPCGLSPWGVYYRSLLPSACPRLFLCYCVTLSQGHGSPCRHPWVQAGAVQSFQHALAA